MERLGGLFGMFLITASTADGSLIYLYASLMIDGDF